jgi:hypothetical protein
VLGLEEEYRERHGYLPEQARRAAVGEVLEGERARQAVPLPWQPADLPQRPPRWRDQERDPDHHDR